MGTGTLESPTEFDVLSREEALVESVFEKGLPVEDRRDEAEPILAPSGAMMCDKSATPVAGAGDAGETGLKGVVTVGEEFVE
jgi:hypothetical protein